MGDNNQRSRIVLLVVMVLGLLLAVGVNVWSVIGAAATLLIVAAAMICIFTATFPRRFVGLILGLLVGPLLFCYLFSTLLAMLQTVCGPTFSKPVFLLLLFGLAVISFLYVRWQLTHLGNQRNELQTNERKPLLPVQAEPERGVKQCVVSGSSSESSGDN